VVGRNVSNTVVLRRKEKFFIAFQEWISFWIRSSNESIVVDRTADFSLCVKNVELQIMLLQQIHKIVLGCSRRNKPRLV